MKTAIFILFCQTGLSFISRTHWVFPKITFSALGSGSGGGSGNKKYPYSNKYFENYLKRLNSKNTTVRDDAIMEAGKDLEKNMKKYAPPLPPPSTISRKQIIISQTNDTNGIQIIINDEPNDDDEYDEYDEDYKEEYEYEDEGGELGRRGEGKYIEMDTGEYENSANAKKKRMHQLSQKFVQTDDDGDNYYTKRDRKSENFEVVKGGDTNFSHIGGYDAVKKELNQIVDLLVNGDKYAKYNVRVPKGLIFEGPPGNGKTMFAKALAGETKTGFISVSGSEFQDKYVGVGSSRIRELFTLAKKNKPCIIFIDEMDALGRKRSNDGEASSSERDSTLNELLVAMDGFKNTHGVFIIGSTNRLDLLDNALLRPGRIDKKIHIGLPDTKTRGVVLDLHIRGKPHDQTIVFSELVEQTSGFSCAEIENTLNEAMLNALRENRHKFSLDDVETVINRQMVGYQPMEHEFSEDIIHRIAVHEMGHAIVGLFSKNHAKVKKVVINLLSPNNPGYTVFENTASSIHTRESLFERIMVLLGGRIAEEVIFNMSITTGAINDFEEAHKLAEKMVLYYGMGAKYPIYPQLSEQYKLMIDTEIDQIIKTAYNCAEKILFENQSLIVIGAEELKKNKILREEDLTELHLHIVQTATA